MSENKADEEREASRLAAIILYRKLSVLQRRCAHACFAGCDEKTIVNQRNFLTDRLAEAKATLEAFDEAISLRRAIDALLPNWHYVDASDHLPDSLWNQFISDDPALWVKWLTDHKVPAPEATRLVDRAFGAVP